MAGRPTKRTPEVEALILGALRDGATDAAAYGVVGISPQTFIDWCHKHPQFLESVQRARAEGRLWHERNWRNSAVGDWKASMEYLARRYPHDWAKRDEVVITIRQQAEKLAAELGLDAAELIAEAERIVSQGAGVS